MFGLFKKKNKPGFDKLYLSYWNLGKGHWCSSIKYGSFDNSNELMNHKEDLDEALDFYIKICSSFSKRKDTDIELIEKLSALNSISLILSSNFSIRYYDFTKKWHASITGKDLNLEWENKDLWALIENIQRDCNLIAV